MKLPIFKEKNVEIQSWRVVLHDSGIIRLQLFGIDREMITELGPIYPDEAIKLSDHLKIAAENAPHARVIK